MQAARLLLCSLLFASAAHAADPDTNYDLTMFRGEARVLNEPGVRRMAVGNGRTLNATVLDQRQVLVLAEEEGQSSIHLWRHNGEEVTYSITVVSADAGRMLSEVRAMMGPGANVQARIVGDKIVLEGNDASSEQARRLEEIGKRYPQVVNLISTVGLEQMVGIDVSILEFRKTALTDIGIRWNTRGVNGPNYGIVGDVHRSQPLGPGGAAEGALDGVPSGARVAPFASYFGLTTTVTSLIDAAVNNGDATFLAEPRLTCKSGGEAHFLAGGEVPIPLANGFGNVTVQFKQYGVKLDVSPLVSESGTISTKVLTELSAIDSNLTIDGIPAFISRHIETEVNLRAGESLIISGLFDGNATKALQKVPGIGDIPVLGELFRSRQYRRNKTELVIFLTPHIITGSAGAMQGIPETPEAAGQKRESARGDIEHGRKKRGGKR
jgi:pilus assembly protein CpaC